MRITSEKNPGIQRFIRLHDNPRVRKSEKRFIIEGVREFRLAVAHEYRIEEIFYCPALIRDSIAAELKRSTTNCRLTEISEKAYRKMAVRNSTEGVLAVAEMKRHRLESVKMNNNPLILVVESVEKPGNLGAILRSSAAADVTAVIVCDPLTDIYNPNLIRASLGGVFAQQIAICTSADAIKWLRLNKIKIYTAVLMAHAKPHYQADYKQPCAIVVGSEAKGLSQVWLEHHDEDIIIPISGGVDSLNVSAAAAVILFEAVRQRKCTSQPYNKF